MDYLKIYTNWANDNFFDEDTRKELGCITSEKEIEDRFYKELEFGTGGLRGIMGAGTNRLNKYTVGKVTLGLGYYLIDTYGKDECIERGVVIGFDTRNNSKEYARVVADVLTGLGLKVYLIKDARPTPQLSFSVPYYKALAGVVLTASHNPKEYNGYKVYDEFGCQLVPSQADRVIQYVNEVKDYHSIVYRDNKFPSSIVVSYSAAAKDGIVFEGNDTLLTFIDNTEEFVSEVFKQQRINNEIIKNNLNIVYTPLHGSGRIPVSKILEMDGFHCASLVDEQANDDGDFSTVKSPNPEDKEALTLGIELAKALNADIVLGTDPDCDRVGIAVKDANNEYKLLTGNQIGSLLMDFIIRHTDLSELEKPAIVKTIVTSELGAKIAEKNDIEVFSTLTEFKFIGEKITQFEKAKDQDDLSRNFDYLFGYEESYGYLCGTHARDKDAVVSSMLICEMAAEAKSQNKTLIDLLNDIYNEYGYYKDVLESFTLKGKDGIEKINAMMSILRKECPFTDVEKISDFNKTTFEEHGFGTYPISNVLKYELKDGSWVAVRPSGTEPKIKIYYSIRGNDESDANVRFEMIQNLIKTRMGL